MKYINLYDDDVFRELSAKIVKESYEKKIFIDIDDIHEDNNKGNINGSKKR